MKARIPNLGGLGNLHQLAQKAQKVQSEMENATKELELKEYSSTSGGGAVSVVVSGKMEIKSIDISPEVVDPEDVEMLSDLIIASINEALREASDDKKKTMDSISSGLDMSGMF